MIAYNRQYLDNRDIQLEAWNALQKNILTPEEYARIQAAYPDRLYTPNPFVRLGLFLLTVLITACLAGLTSLGTIGSESGWATLFIVLGLLCYGALEVFIHTRRMHEAGVDDALLWCAGGLLLGGINIGAEPISATGQSTLVLLLAVWGVLRYAGPVTALIAYGALLSLLFYSTSQWGPVARALMPFLVLVVSAGLYELFTRMTQSHLLRHYHTCLVFLRVCTLVSFYAAGNYFVVRELNAFISGSSGPVALGWLWWILTAVTPVFYVVRGVQKKDRFFLWAGLILAAASIATVRYYYHIMPAEQAMVLGGIALIGGAYVLIRYLRVSRNGITSEPADIPVIADGLPVEGLVLAETLRATAVPPDSTGIHFGGGSGGGGGAGGEF